MREAEVVEAKPSDGGASIETLPEGARPQLRDVLTVEVVPLSREIAEGELAKLDDPP